MGWVPGDRVTEADRQHDTKSLQRALDSRLVLIVKATGAPSAAWPRRARSHRCILCCSMFRGQCQSSGGF